MSEDRPALACVKCGLGPEARMTCTREDCPPTVFQRQARRQVASLPPALRAKLRPIVRGGLVRPEKLK